MPRELKAAEQLLGALPPAPGRARGASAVWPEGRRARRRVPVAPRYHGVQAVPGRDSGAI